MKNNRQEKILAIIEAEPIETQEQLLAKLQEQGIESTQATISRDIKQLHLIKEPVGGGRYRYAVSAQKIKLNFAGRLQVILRESILSADRAQNLVVVKMMPASAPRQAPPSTAWRSPLSSARSAATTRCSSCCATSRARRNSAPS